MKAPDPMGGDMRDDDDTEGWDMSPGNIGGDEAAARAAEAWKAIVSHTAGGIVTYSFPKGLSPTGNGVSRSICVWTGCGVAQVPELCVNTHKIFTLGESTSKLVFENDTTSPTGSRQSTDGGEAKLKENTTKLTKTIALQEPSAGPSP